MEFNFISTKSSIWIVESKSEISTAFLNRVKIKA